jgi:hypothetical protein
MPETRLPRGRPGGAPGPHGGLEIGRFRPGAGRGEEDLDPARQRGAIARVREGFPQRLSSGNEVSRALGADDASDAVVVPFVVRDKVSGAAYADVSGAAGALDADAIALLTWLAGVVVDRLAKRKLVPSPALRDVQSSAGIAPSEIPPSFASIPLPNEPAAPLPRDQGIPAPPPAAAIARPVRRQRPAEGAGLERPLGGPLAPNERGNEARRFARLLASEIKLYNERAVTEGRAHGDLYARLRQDIERGRRLYEERVPADVRSRSDYYYEELVEVLAGGRPEALK